MKESVGINIYGEMPDFSKAKAGDRCWSNIYGLGKIAAIRLIRDEPICASFQLPAAIVYKDYTLSGHCHKNSIWPELFHSKPVLLIPPQVVDRTETVEAWLVDTNTGGIWDKIFSTETEAKDYQSRTGWTDLQVISLTGTRTIREPQEWELMKGWAPVDSLVSTGPFSELNGRPVISCFVIGFRPKEHP